jgi:glycosyltransferase involved in cell wall biosynthesis
MGIQVQTMTRSVSVVMAAWNAEPFIEAAVRSVLGQTHPILELIVVNDGSTDATLERLKAIGATDSRLRVLTQANQGFSAARNAALREARGEWIAVADADDLQLPHRIAVQMAALDRNPKVTVCGAGIGIWDGESAPTQHASLSPSDDGIRALLPFESPLFDPTVIYRASLLPDDRLAYDPSFRMAADYDLWSRLASRACFMNLGEVVTWYRRHPHQVTATARKSGLSLKERSRVWKRVLGDLLSITPGDADYAYHDLISAWPAEVPRDRVRGIAGWFRRLREGDGDRGCVDSPTWISELSRRWSWVHRHAVPSGPAVVGQYFSSALAWNSVVSIRSKVALIARGFGAR